MKNTLTFLAVLLAAASVEIAAQVPEIPLPEHPRPDFERAQWINLNGTWSFNFDSLDAGVNQEWFEKPIFTEMITVPFPWGSKLSGVQDLADIGWYSRQLDIPDHWEGNRTFLVIGACDWLSTLWIDGHYVGTHAGGYTPFEFDLTEYVSPGKSHQLVMRVDDTPHSFKLEGKQGYGEAKGIWQTAYLESRGSIFLSQLQFTPDIDKERVRVHAVLDQPASEDLYLNLSFPNKEIQGIITSPRIEKKQQEIEFEVQVPDPQLWDLQNPYLYQVKATLHNNESVFDELSSYFGMRKISIMDLPGSRIPYVALNNKPIYLQLSLDQAYHPDGFYTYPSDAFHAGRNHPFQKDRSQRQPHPYQGGSPEEALLGRQTGAADHGRCPQFLGRTWGYSQKRMGICHAGNDPTGLQPPFRFFWVLFNETWGLFTGKGAERAYLPETQDWVRDMYHEAKDLDPSRLVEDNSPCNYDHVITDLNTWHAYLPGYRWEEFLDHVEENTFVGSEWNFIGGNKQTRVPMFNSECGNVWGYTGSTGDVDWSWDYHIMMNEFRKHPKVAGWLYTEHHDVINEWNGYYKFDRTEKFTGFSDFIPDMDLNQLHSEVYLSTGSELCRAVRPGSTLSVPLYLSVMTDQVPPDHYILDYELSGRDHHGKFQHVFLQTEIIESLPWFQGEVTPLSVTMPDTPGLYHLTLRLRDENAYIYHLNFTSFLVEERKYPQGKGQTQGRSLTFAPHSFADAGWTMGQWNILEGLKVNGAGAGYFSYDLDIPETLLAWEVKKVTLVFEASAKKLHGKDREDKSALGGDYMRGRGTFDPSRNPNSYPMTDTYKDPTLVKVKVNGKVVDAFYLEDDPADHRGVLSWHAQPRDNQLREAGSYGYLCKSNIPLDLIRNSSGKKLNIRFEVDEALPGGLAIYGKRFGRYALDPTLLFE
jgi:hypothetical protein